MSICFSLIIIFIYWVQSLVKFIELKILLEKIVISLFVMNKLISKVLLFHNWFIILENCLSFHSISTVLPMEAPVLRQIISFWVVWIVAIQILISKSSIPVRVDQHFNLGVLNLYLRKQGLRIYVIWALSLWVIFLFVQHY